MYIIKGTFNTGDEYEDIATTEEELLETLRSIESNPCARIPDKIERDGVDVTRDYYDAI